MNSIQLTRNIIILIEKYEKFLKFYYADGHYEFFNSTIRSLTNKEKKSSGYKQPIHINGQELYPTQNQRDLKCKWINLAYIDEQDINYMLLLKEKGLIEKTKKMYFKYKEEQLFSLL